MKSIPIDMVRRLFSYEPETGILTWKSTSSNRAIAGSKAGSAQTNGYLSVFCNGSRWGVHRIAWAHFHGKFPDQLIDHINGVRDDNRIENLRVVSASENSQNMRRPMRNSKTGVLGVTVCNNKFKAQIGIPRIGCTYLGLFDTANEAQQAYLSAKRAIHPGCLI